MEKMPTSARAILSSIVFLLWSIGGDLQAAEVSATATLSRNVTVVGAPVVLTITVQGARGADAPRSIDVDNLDIRYAGQSTQIQMRNFQMSAEVTHSYRVVPRAPGEYTIPAQNIVVGGDRIRTNPVTLNVRSSNRNTARRAPSNLQDAPDDPVSLDDLARAELIIPKDSAYVGEAVPMELRFYFDGNTNFRANSGPNLPSEGFTLEPFPEPRQEETTVGNRRFSLVTFQSVITPVKAGDLELGPATMDVTASIRRARPNINHLADQFFSDPFFNQSFGGFTSNEDISIKSDAHKLTVKPLPTEGQPAEFGGSVGQFDISADADAKKVAIGDPLTLKVTVSGRGNFDRMEAPTIDTGSSWRAYPPSDKFEKDDTLGVSGTKTFSYQLVPTDRADKLPPVSFSYFDPAREKYVTVVAKEMPILVTGLPLAAATPTPTQSTAPTPEKSEAPAEPNDILGLATTAEPWGQSFTLLYRRAGFLYGQAVPALALVGLLAMGGYRRWSSDVTARRSSALRAQRTQALAELKKSGTSRDEFYARAVRVLQLETACRTGSDPQTLHERDVQANAAADDATATGLRRIFAAHDEAAYSGGGTEPSASPTERQEVLETVQRFLDRHA